MSVQVISGESCEPSECLGCHGTKGAPIAAIVTIGHNDDNAHFALCQECGRDATNAIGFMCIKDGGWSKLEPRKRKVK